ncbi:MAG: low molecular weight phosphotyrosine protein phosphatase [Rhodospirillaceae bacterium]|nr:MAG: low molecular weight phosphotyrosine protein phosphatase [Rhodospirillaceae bacterium]
MAQATLPGLKSGTYKVLFVCTGNICRSPTAEAVFRHHVAAAGLDKQIGIDSAGTHTYHVGEPVDSRSVEAAAARGFDMAGMRVKTIAEDDFQIFDLILAMDIHHHNFLSARKPNDARATVKLFLDYHPKMSGRNVPDPYYGSPEDFKQVLELIDEASRGLLAELKRQFK